MKTLILTLFIASLLPALCNTDERNWRLKDGETMRAELVNVNEESGEAELLINDTEKVFRKIEDFSEADIAWLYEWLNIQDELNELIKITDGKTEHKVFQGEYETDLFCYYPSTYEEATAKSFPLMILFHPGGKAQRYLAKHIESAEESGFLTITLGQFRNTGDDKEKEDAFLERFKEVFAHIREDYDFDPAKVFMGGGSGGAWKAYHYTAWVDYPWAGIYANGGWLGGENYYDLDYGDNMSVAMVNGNNDHANRWIEPDTKILSQHDCNVAVFSFEGGHQGAPSKTQARAFKWLLNPDG